MSDQIMVLFDDYMGQARAWAAGSEASIGKVIDRARSELTAYCEEKQGNDAARDRPSNFTCRIIDPDLAAEENRPSCLSIRTIARRGEIFRARVGFGPKVRLALDRCGYAILNGGSNR